MNHYAARPRKNHERWDYTIRQHDYVFATGYCQGWQDFDVNGITRFMGADGVEWARRDHEAKAAFKDKYHTDGHSTEEDACACYRTYLLDHARFGVRTTGWGGCEVERCDVPGKFGAQIGGRLIPLCATH